ncbi:MAG: DUF4271 domain-containing protein [Mangrovibacterium sp.]
MIKQAQPKDSLTTGFQTLTADSGLVSSAATEPTSHTDVVYSFPQTGNADVEHSLAQRAPLLRYQSSLKELVKEDYPILLPLKAPTPEAPKLVTEFIGLPTRKLPEKPIAERQADWVVGVIIVVFALFASVRLLFGKYLQQLFYASVNYTTAARLFRERSISLTHAAFRLDLIFYLVISLFLFLIFDSYIALPFDIPILKYLLLLAGTTLYFGLKQVIYASQGRLTQSGNETQELLYNMNLYNRILGLGLIPIVLIMGFSRLKSPDIMIGIGVLLAAGTYILLLLRGLKILMKKDFPLFYLILYLCTLEILPLFYIYKLVLV